ncbi:MAG: hypothetical protein ABGY09_06295 [Euryarchaeota archaeon]
MIPIIVMAGLLLLLLAIAIILILALALVLSGRSSLRRVVLEALEFLEESLEDADSGEDADGDD